MATETQTEAGTLHAGTDPLLAEEAHFPPFNPEFFASQLLWLAICFIAFYYIVKKLALPRIGGILEVRRDRIASDLDHAQRLKEQSDDAIAGYEQALTAARQKAYGIAEEARAEATKASDAKRAASEAELNEKLAAAERRIADIKARALGEVNGIATETAETVIETLLGSKAPRDEVESAVARAAKE